MVRMTGDAIRREHYDAVHTPRAGCFGHLGHQRVQRHVAEPSVGVVAQIDCTGAQCISGAAQFLCTDLGQITRHAVERRGLSAGEAQDVHLAAGRHERGQHAAESERLVVRVGDNCEQSVPVGQ